MAHGTRKFETFEEAGLKIHSECCGGDAPMYMGFSRFSPHYKEEPNPNYEASKKLSPTNFPTIVSPGCVAYKFGQALQALKKSGKTAEIYGKYFSQ